MAPTPSKHGRDQAMDFRGFLNDLQDWELSLKDKDKKMKPQVSDKAGTSSRTSAISENRRSATAGSSKVDVRKGKPGLSNYVNNYDVPSHLSSSFSTEDTVPDATSEKELGNEFFKQKKFNEAIDCYSRSIAFSPTAVAYANRAMAYLKIKRFQEAEDDCTEALNLDDRYIKAYSRRATARKEIGKFKESLEDAEFALRLEPDNQEIKKQYAEAKSLFEKEVLKKTSGVVKSPAPGQKTVKLENGQHTSAGPSGGNNSETGALKDNIKEKNDPVSFKSSAPVQEIQSAIESESKNYAKTSAHKDLNTRMPVEGSKGNDKTGRQELKPSVQELATQASARALLEAENNITPPKSAYQFEVSWRGFSGSRSLQSRLLKVISPSSLPQIFKNALSAPLLIDIIKCLATFFIEDMELAVSYLDNLTKVPRFDMLIMCLSNADKAELLKVWSEVFCGEATPIEYAEILDALRSKYGLKR